MTAPVADTDDCAFLGGKLMLRQMRSGHRAGTDACLLAAAIEAADGERIADVGAGAGAAALAALSRIPEASAVLIERDPCACALSWDNIAINGFAERARAITADIFDRTALFDLGLVGCADVVISNPPFYDAHTVRKSPDIGRAAAHVANSGTHGAWLRAMAQVAGPRGRLVLIHVPQALPALLANWPSGWGAITLRPIHSFADRAATRVLISAIASSRAPLSLLQPLVLHGSSGAFTTEAQRIHQGMIDTPLMKRPA